MRGTIYNIEDFQKRAMKKNGKCLSERHINSKTKLKFQCGKGHIWETLPHSIIAGHWCPVCGDTVKSTISEMQKIAENRHGKCNSINYINSHTKLSWQCENGHVWNATPNDIKSGTWCPVCERNRRKDNWVNQFSRACQFKKNEFDNLKELAKRNGGECLSNEYFNSKIKLKWQCSKGHIWEAAPQFIKRGHWCHICGISKAMDNRTGITTRLTIKEMQELAIKKGGKCLSNKYINATTKLIWQCKENHIWESTPFSIKSEDTWCPICSQGISERICRKYFEEIFGEKFPKRKPNWLINSSGKRMELDGYCSKLKIAFEYQGRQHYENIKYYKKNGQDYLEKRITDDKTKLLLCQKEGIALIQVPYTIGYEEMGTFIIKKAGENQKKIPNITSGLNYRVWDIYSPERIKEMRLFAESKGGKCLSEKYITNSINLIWQCKNGHVWDASPSNILNGKWCPSCALEYKKGSKKYSLDYLRVVAEKKHGKLLSTAFFGIRHAYTWECEIGHKFETTAFSIMYQNTWCPTCGIERMREKRKKYNLKELNDYAKIKEGICLSDKFISSNEKMLWQCKHGHTWYAKWADIMNNHWCPVCSGHHRFTIDFIKKFAEKKKGDCLSTEYKNTSVKLLWKCEKDHVWEASLNSVKGGHWCPTCEDRKKPDIEKMHELAKSKNGRCLSPDYISAKTKLKWQCSHGHTWEAIPDSIRRGSWCPICYKINKKTNWKNQFSDAWQFQHNN